MSRIKNLIMMLLMVMSLSTSAQDINNEQATTGVVSAELQTILLADEDLKNAIDEVDPEEALPFSEESLEEISHAEAFCFDRSTRTMMLWGSNFEEKVMVWGSGLRYSFLAEIKKGKISIERATKFIPEPKSVTVWTPMGKIKTQCHTKGKKKTTIYCVKR